MTDLALITGTVKTNLFRARAEIKAQVEELGRKQGIKLYTIAVFPIFTFFMDTEAQAAALPAFMQQGIFLNGNVISKGDGLLSSGQQLEVTNTSRETAGNLFMNSNDATGSMSNSVSGASSGSVSDGVPAGATGNVPNGVFGGVPEGVSAGATVVGSAVVKTGGANTVIKLLIAAICFVVVIGGGVIFSMVRQDIDNTQNEIVQEEDEDSEDDVEVEEVANENKFQKREEETTDEKVDETDAVEADKTEEKSEV